MQVGHTRAALLPQPHRLVMLIIALDLLTEFPQSYCQAFPQHCPGAALQHSGGWVGDSLPQPRPFQRLQSLSTYKLNQLSTRNIGDGGIIGRQ
jgi:hypothetical protein